MTLSVEKRACVHTSHCQLHRLDPDSDYRSGVVDANLITAAAHEGNSWAREPHWKTEMSGMAAPPWWREDLRVGACDDPPPTLTGRWGDCEAGEAGSFRLHGPMRETTETASTRTEREFLSAAISCHWLCMQCNRCRYVSFARRSPQECIWRNQCRGFDGNTLNGNERFRTARVRSDAAVPALPAPTASTASTADEEASLRRRRLILITATYPHSAQLDKLGKCAALVRGALSSVERILWIVAEDASAKTPAVASLLAELVASSKRLAHHHIAVGPTRSKGHKQRSLALRWLQAEGIDGVIYNLDDDNEYHPALWPALLALKPGRVGVLSVGFPTGLGHFMKGEVVTEGPVYAPDGRLRGFSAGWCHDALYKFEYGPRFFCIDMGGFAFDASLLRHVRGVPWSYGGRQKRGSNATEWRGGESEFVEQLLPRGYPEDLQPLANCGHDILVMHNAMDFPPEHARAHAMAPGQQRTFCRDHGW